MSTLEYLDGDGNVAFWRVSTSMLHKWLSKINGNPHVKDEIPDAVNRGKVIGELKRRSGKPNKIMEFARGDGNDWREYENAQGYTHLEELLIYTPNEWRKQAREYTHVYNFDLERSSDKKQKRSIKLNLDGVDHPISIDMKTPILVVLFHPELPRSNRYETLNFLLANGIENPLPSIIDDSNTLQCIMKEISPLDYFFEFQRHVKTYKMEGLKYISKKSGVSRLYLIHELLFSNVVGQRLAKEQIIGQVITWCARRSPKEGLLTLKSPLSLIFSGPSGNGKTELAQELAVILNKPSDNAFHKVDCGKLTCGDELFGMSGPYQGAREGSALNNFIKKMAGEKIIGVVLLDEIEKADRSVIHGLYQVIDKGEWTNKQLVSGSEQQTSIIDCSNIIFIMTTNAADELIQNHAKKDEKYYTSKNLAQLGDMLEADINKNLRDKKPFTKAFLGRIDAIIPFLPLSAYADNKDKPKLLEESLTITKILIDQEQDKIQDPGNFLRNETNIPIKTKHEIAQIIVKKAVPDAGVRALQKGVQTKMGDRLLLGCLQEKGGISRESEVYFFTDMEESKIDMYSGEPSRTQGSKLSMEDDIGIEKLGLQDDIEDTDLFA